MKWFPHDTDASSNHKVEKIIMKYGADGYAIYFYCLECIARPIGKHKLSFELDHDAEIIGYKFKIDTLRVEEIMKYLVASKLFEYDDVNNKITCIKLAKRLNNSIVKNPQLAEIQRKLKENGILENPGLSQIVPDSPGQSQKTGPKSRIIPENPGQIRLDKTREEKESTSQKNQSGKAASSTVQTL